MWIKIKNDAIRLDEILFMSFNDAEGSVIISSKMGATFAYGQEFRQGMITRERMINRIQYAAIKAWFNDKQNPEVVV